MDRKYYTIVEAGEKIDGSAEDIIHYIETNQLEGRLLVKNKHYLFMHWEPENGLIARGTFFFSGLLAVDKTWIKQLLDVKKIILNKRANPHYITELRQFSSENPFTSGRLPDGVKNWEGLPESELGKKLPYMLPMPAEVISTKHMMAEMLEKIQAIQNTPPTIDKNNVPEFNFNFSANGTFIIEDLRISEIDLDKLRKQDKAKSDEVENLPWCDSKAKSRRIDMVIERLYRINYELPNRKLWHVLEIDCKKENPVYDTEQIIDGMDARALDWAKVDETTRPLTFKSFENRLSDIRRFYVDTGSEEYLK